MDKLLEISLLGTFLLKYKNEPVKETISHRAQILLAYLLLNVKTQVSRRQVAFHFWPDSTEKQAFANLRNLLTQLRSSLPVKESYLVVDRQTLQWNPLSSFRLDVDEFERAVLKDDIKTAVDLYTGDLLPDCYEDWVQPHRERLREDFERSIEKFIQTLEEARDYEGAIKYAQYYLQHDPLKESTYRQLMRLHALQGSRTEALRVFNQCELVLGNELGVKPEDATRKAHEQILHSTGSLEPSCGGKNDLPLVARGSEWGNLLKSWRSAAAGSPGMVLLVGEAGIGKTRILEEFREWAFRQGITTAFTRCYSAQGRLSYAPITGWLRCPTIKDKLGGLEEVWLVEIARLLPEMYTQIPQLPKANPIKEGWQQMRLFEALARGIFSAPQPLLLVLDDIHWADQETIAWLSYLLRFDPDSKLLVLCSLRPEETGVEQSLAPLFIDLQRDGLLTEFEINQFGLKETIDLVESVSGRSCPQEEGERIFTETEGNPLFIVEMVQSRARITGEKKLPGKAGLFEQSYRLPGKVEAVIASRLSQLSGQAQALAALASASGRQFNLQVLSLAWKSSENELVAGLEELLRRRIVRELTEGCDFAHDKIREAVYQRLSSSHRSLMHRELAQALENLHAGEGDSISGEIAGHYIKAGLGSKALPYLLKASEQAVRLYANHEAIHHLHCGVNIITSSSYVIHLNENDGKIIFSILDLLGDVLERIGDHQGARNTYELIFRCCLWADPVRLAQTHRKIGQTWLAQQNLDSMQKAYNAAEEALGSLNDTPGQSQPEYQLNWRQERLNIFTKRMWLHYWLDEPEMIQELAEKSLPLLNICGSPYQRADYYGCLAGMVLRRERYAESKETIQYMRMALEAAKESGDEGLIGYIYFGLGYSLLWAGETTEAEEHMLKSIGIAEKIGDEQTLVLTLAYLSFVYRKMGRVAHARKVIERAFETATLGKRPLYVAIAISNQAWLAWLEGDNRKAQRLGESALEIWGSLPIPFAFNWSAHWPIIGAALMEKNLSTAIEHARKLFSPDQQAQPDRIIDVLQKSINSWESECEDDARLYLEEAVRMASEMGYL